MAEERRDVRKAKQAIKQAFIDLSIHQDIRKITVSRILELADVSRGTFYAHFKDVYDGFSKEYKIVVVERADYGYSEDTSKSRDVSVILSETRQS